MTSILYVDDACARRSPEHNWPSADERAKALPFHILPHKSNTEQLSGAQPLKFD